jgi:transposase
MYKELLPLQETVAEELRERIQVHVLPGMDPEKLLKAYLGQLTLNVGVDVGDATMTAVIVDDAGEILGSLVDFANAPQGFVRFKGWVEQMRMQHSARIIVVAGECSGVYYEEFWRYLKADTDYARVLYNARTTEHMGEVLSKSVRDDEVDGYLLAEQVRLGSTPEAQVGEDLDLLEARACSRIARDIAGEICRKKNQLRSLIRTFNPAFSRVFPGAKFWSAPARALLQRYVFPEDLVQLGVDRLADELEMASNGRLGQAKAEVLIRECLACYASPGQRDAVRLRVQDLLEDISRLKKRQNTYLKMGYKLIEHRPETPLVRAIGGAGISNTLAIVSEASDPARFKSGAHLASFFGLTTSKHVSGTTLFVSKHITKQGTRNGRYAVCNLANYLRRKVPKYSQMYQRIKNRKPPRKGHWVAVVAVARDFVTNILYDMLINHRPFFVEVEDYRRYRQQQRQAAA